MAIYLLNYDLINERGSFDYAPLWKELKRLNGHKTQYSSWLLNLTNSVTEVVDHFKQFVDKDDRLWATRLRPNEYHYVNAMSGTNAWLKENPPA